MTLLTVHYMYLFVVKSNNTVASFFIQMGTKRDLSTSVRAQISILHKEGLSYRQISSRLRISVGTVNKSLKRITQLNNYDLQIKIREIRNSNISAEYCKKCVDSMPFRIQSVLKAKGQSISY